MFFFPSFNVCCFNRFLCMIINNNEFEANHHALKHNSTLPSDAFLSFADFDVHEKDPARSEKDLF